MLGLTIYRRTKVQVGRLTGKRPVDSLLVNTIAKTVVITIDAHVRRCNAGAFIIVTTIINGTTIISVI